MLQHLLGKFLKEFLLESGMLHKLLTHSSREPWYVFVICLLVFMCVSLATTVTLQDIELQKRSQIIISEDLEAQCKAIYPDFGELKTQLSPTMQLIIEECSKEQIEDINKLLEKIR